MIDPTGIIETVVGAFLGWMANHFYSRQGSKELKRLNDGFQRDNMELRATVEKLPSQVAELLAADRRKQLTVRELNELLDHVTTDPASGEFTRCPQCGSERLKPDRDVDVDVEGDSASLNYFIDIITCEDCGWSNYIATSPSGQRVFDRVEKGDSSISKRKTLEQHF
jgi:predicted nucleic-acid-binding Zn-ribbon protein